LYNLTSLSIMTYTTCTK